MKNVLHFQFLKKISLLCSFFIFGLSNAQSYSSISLNSEVNKLQPMTGIVFWSDNGTDLNTLGNKVQLEYSYLVYSDVIQQEGQYDWSSVDNLLAQVASNGRQAILRFRYTYPGVTAPSVPNYIRNSSGYQDQIESVEGSNTYIPDWSSQALQDFTLEFFTEFADRYDNDPRLAFVQVGFGSYSEYHLYDGPLRFGETFPTKAYQTTFMEHVNSVFKETQWSISIDAGSDQYTPIADSNSLLNLGYGLFDDSFLHEEHSTSNNEYNRSLWLTFGTNRADNYAAGGELNYYSTRDQQTVLNVAGPYGFTFEEMAELYDITYMIGNDQLNYQSTSRIEDAGMATGYKFEVTDYTSNGSSTQLTIKNNGIAPIYYDAYPTVSGVKSSTSLKGLIAGQSRSFTVNTGASGEDLTISCDRLVPGQEIQFDANINGGTVSNTLTVSTPSTFSENGGSQNITITSNVNWTVSESSSWISVNTTNGSNNGTVSITTTTNTATSGRSATVTISGEGITRSITINQDGEDEVTTGNSFTPDPNKTYYIDAPYHNLRLSADGEQVEPETVPTSTTGADVEWKFVAKGNGSWHIQRAAGGTLPRLRTDNSAEADMQGTAWSGTYTYYEFNEGYIDGSYFVTLTDGPTNFKRLQVNSAGEVKMVSTASNRTWESFTFTEVNETTTTSCSGGTNLALNASVIDFSSEQNSTNGITNLIDGNDGNRWSASGFPQSAVLDLGDQYSINQVNLMPYGDRAYQFLVEGSASSATSGFSVLTDARGNTSGGSQITKSFNTQTVRYVKLTITGASGYTGTWSSIEDFEIICAGSNSKDLSETNTLFHVNAYPSPFTDSITVESQDELQTIGGIQLIDMTGSIVSSALIDGNKGQLSNLNGLGNGVYLLQIFNDDNKTIKVIKFIKQ